MNSLSVKHLSKSYKNRNIVKNIHLDVCESEAVGLLGPNGTGKTTSFFMIAGLLSPDYGQIYINGLDVTNLPTYKRARLGLSYLPQESSIFTGLTVAENIMAILQISEKSLSIREQKLESLLAEFSLTHLKNVSGAVLSGGERRRVEIARCLASNPKYILLDEPLAGVDPIAVEEIKDIIAGLKKKGIGILITDHNVQETLRIVDRCYVIYDGAVLADGDAKSIASNQKVRALYLGQSFQHNDKYS